MNQSDSERISAVLESIGYKITDKIERANLVVINMCSVRQSAVDRVFGLSEKLKDMKGKRTILTGCVQKRDKRKFAELFDYIVDIKDIVNLPKILKKKPVAKKDYLKIVPNYLSSFSAIIPIMTGCNNFCSYCVVPSIRGREVSRPAEEIICEIKNLINRDYKEIWLLGQNVNSYKDGAISFPKLLRMIDNIPGKFWIRFTSSHPKDFSDELITAMAKGKKISPYLNLPVQAGDDKILKQMNRPYTVAQYKNAIKKVRKAIPDIALSTDIIVGFPGETKKQFSNSAKLFKEIKYDMAYISEYSHRSGTSASKMKDTVDKKEKKSRKEVLNEILKKTGLENNKKFLGKEVEVLIDRKKPGIILGKSWHYKTVKIDSKKDLVGKFVQVKITKALSWGLEGDLI